MHWWNPTRPEGYFPRQRVTHDSLGILTTSFFFSHSVCSNMDGGCKINPFQPLPQSWDSTVLASEIQTPAGNISSKVARGQKKNPHFWFPFSLAWSIHAGLEAAATMLPEAKKPQVPTCKCQSVD